MADIFISYARAHHETTRNLARDLEAAGYSVWWDTSLLTGDVYRTTLDEQIEAAKAVIIVWTPESINSLWVVAEAEHALRLGKLFNTLHGVRAEKVPKPFNQVHAVDVTDRAAILTSLSANGVSPSVQRSGATQFDSARPDRRSTPRKGRSKWLPATLAGMAAIGAVAVYMNSNILSEAWPDLAARLGSGWGGTVAETMPSSGHQSKDAQQADADAKKAASDRLRSELRDREAALEEAKRKTEEAEKRNQKLIAERTAEEARQAETARRQLREQQERLEKAQRLADEAELRSAQIKAENLSEEQRRQERARLQRLEEQARIDASNRAAEENRLLQQKIEAEAQLSATRRQLDDAQRLAAAAAAAAAAAGSSVNQCEQLWMARNTIFAQHGHCFETPKAISVFGRGCRPPFGKLTSTAKARVDSIQVQELRLGCR